MPKYVVFLIVPYRFANRSEAEKTSEDTEIKKDPHFQKMMQEFLNWMDAELKADRVKGGDFLLESTEETNIRVDFHNQVTSPEVETEKRNDGPDIPPPKSSMTRGHQDYVSTNILGYYTAEFPTTDEVVAWARSCPISYDGFALEIRELQDNSKAIGEAPEEVKEWAGDQILHARKQLLEEGKMKKEEDGTQWVKLEDEEGIKEIVTEAEKREAENE